MQSDVAQTAERRYHARFMAIKQAELGAWRVQRVIAPVPRSGQVLQGGNTRVHLFEHAQDGFMLFLRHWRALDELVLASLPLWGQIDEWHTQHHLRRGEEALVVAPHVLVVHCLVNRALHTQQEARQG